MSEPEMKLRDLIYFDEAKVISLLSQLEEGLLKESVESTETSGKKSGGLKLSLGVFEGTAGGESTGKAIMELTRIRFHDMLVRLEDTLFRDGFAVDINTALRGSEITSDGFRKKLFGVNYLRAEGEAVIDDFARLQEFIKDFNTITSLINRSARFSVEQTPTFQELSGSIEAAKANLKSISDRNEKSKQKQVLDQLQVSLDQILGQVLVVAAPPDWLQQGIADWIRIFNANQIHLRIRPFEMSPIEVVANLKRSCFVDTDINHLMFSYGTRPNVSLTVFGLITSMPPAEETRAVHSHSRDNQTQEGKQAQALNDGFRSVFNSMSAFESYSGFAQYPHIKVHPMAVYRQLKPGLPHLDTLAGDQ